MFVRIYWGRIYPGSWPSIEERYRALMEIDIPGLRARLVTRDVNDPESMFTITIWDTVESVQAWEASEAYQDVFLAAVRPFLVGSQSVSLSEVRVENLTELLPVIRAATQ
ncbi:antibiotic biosynthesis monooxygenase family protein [Microvirga calopogonii]|uniref:antibiotic biosynthesis monooxygenase family protein n=1 Tax=Microvirga calopogonii TaxID=2078013 RepID=UPI000E0E00DD|nr:antibiotic biosynthesis monooxygenase [Microvirga calopogonii]